MIFFPKNMNINLDINQWILILAKFKFKWI